jgi:SnoaL-like domain
MSSELEMLSAKQAITEVLYRYCHAVDRIDPELGSRIWHADGLAHYEGIFEGSGAVCMASILEQHKKCDATSHQLTNMLIEVDGDRATSESYVTACVRAGDVDVVVRGRYMDAWSRRDREWRIDDRRYRHDVVQIIPVSKQQLPTPESPS